MNPPGWYADPAGAPHTYRWWDGQAWSAATTQSPTTTPPPQNVGPQPGPGTSPAGGKPKKIIIAVSAGIVAIALIVTGAVVIPRLGAAPLGTSTPTAAPSAPNPTGPQSPAPSTSTGPAQLNCAGGNGRTTGDQSPIYSSSGLQYEAPDDWGFRYDMSQWTWLDSQAVWGTVDIEPADEEWGAGVALGGVRVANGFTDPESAAEDLVTCFMRYGFANDGSWKATEESAEDVTVGKMTGHRAVYLVSDGSNGTYPGYQVVSLVLDTGRDGSFGTWMSFGPKGEPITSAQIEAAEKSITGN